MEASRRSFLRGALALVGASAVVQPIDLLAHARVPVLYGDGVNCDCDGLQALLEGRPVNILNDAVNVVRANDRLLLGEGSFLLSKTLRVAPIDVEIHGSRFAARSDFDGEYLVCFGRGSGKVSIRDCYLDIREVERSRFRAALNLHAQP